MALEQKIVPLNFAGGLDRKIDPFQVSPGSFLTLTNAEFENPGRVNKRKGFSSLGRYIAGTNDRITSGVGLAARNEELVAFSETNAYSYSQSSGQWTDKGQVQSLAVDRLQVDTNASASDYDINGATHESGLQCYAMVRDTSTTTEVYIAVVDTVSGQIIRPAEAVFTNGWRPKVIPYRNSFLIYVVDRLTATINVARLQVQDPLAPISFTVLTGNAADTGSLATTQDYQGYDVIRVDSPQGGNDAIYMVFNNRAAATGTSLWWFDSDSVTAAQTKVAISSQAARRCAVIYDAFRDGPAIAFWDGTTLRYRLYSADLVTLRSFGNVAAVANLRAVTGVSMSETFVDLRWYYNGTGSSAPIYVARTTDTVASVSIAMGVPFSYGATSVSVLARSVQLASKAWKYADTPYIATTHSSVLQATYFVLNGETGQVCGRLLPGIGVYQLNGVTYGTALTSNLPEVSAVSDTAFRFAAGEALGLGSSTDLTYGLVNGAVACGVSALTLDFADSERSYRTAEAAGSLHLNGGLLQMYDGISFVEHGFNLFPEDASVSGLSAGSTHSYAYKFCYEWSDNAGNLHRSQPSPTVTVTSGAVISALNDASISFPTLRLTQKTEANGRSAVMLAVYRTEDNGTVFYRLPYTSSNINDTSVDALTIVDDTEDADLIDGAPLYTNGNVVANVTSPPPLALVTHKNRLWVVDATNPLSISYSKLLSPGIPVEFGLNFNVNVSPKGGPVTAIASMDDKLIIFKRNSIYMVTGDGPAADGSGDDLSAATFITSDCGCLNQRSVGTVPDGLMFQSDKGIKLLTRSLASENIGAQVQDLTVANCTSTVQIADRNQIRLTFDDRTCLMFDYYVGQWSQFTNIDAVDSIVWNQNHVYLRSSGMVLEESSASYTDDGSFIQRKIKTAWLSFAGLQGYQRIYRILLLGRYESAHKLFVDVAYDFNPVPVQTLEIEPTAATTYGSTSPYGGDAVYGGTFAPYQWRVNVARQKCQSIQLTIRDTQNGSDPGASSTLSGMTVLVGIIGQTNRMPSTQSVG